MQIVSEIYNAFPESEGFNAMKQLLTIKNKSKHLEKLEVKSKHTLNSSVSFQTALQSQTNNEPEELKPQDIVRFITKQVDRNSYGLPIKSPIENRIGRLNHRVTRAS